MEDRQELLAWLEKIHGLLERMDGRLAQLTRQTDLQRETLDSVLVNTMEAVDRMK